jgi:hypothetical protein
MQILASNALIVDKLIAILASEALTRRGVSQTA